MPAAMSHSSTLVHSKSKAGAISAQMIALTAIEPLAFALRSSAVDHASHRSSAVRMSSRTLASTSTVPLINSLLESRASAHQLSAFLSQCQCLPRAIRQTVQPPRRSPSCEDAPLSSVESPPIALAASVQWPLRFQSACSFAENARSAVMRQRFGFERF